MANPELSQRIQELPEELLGLELERDHPLFDACDESTR